MVQSVKQKSITGRQDKHRSRLDPIVPLVRRGLQPTGLICHVEAFQVPMEVDEDPSQVTDFPALPSTNHSRALHIRPLGVAQSDSDVHR